MRGGGGQKSRKYANVIYERPLKQSDQNPYFSSFNFARVRHLAGEPERAKMAAKPPIFASVLKCPDMSGKTMTWLRTSLHVLIFPDMSDCFVTSLKSLSSVHVVSQKIMSLKSFFG